MLNLLIATTLTVILTYLYSRLPFKRFKQYAALPQIPNSLFAGHLLKIREYMRHAPANAHPDEILRKMHEDVGRPPLMLLDLRPLNKPVVVIANHGIAEQLSKSSAPCPYKHRSLNTTLSDLEPLLGSSSMMSAEGRPWTELRKTYGRGFDREFLLTLVGSMAVCVTLWFTGDLDLEGEFEPGDDSELALMNTATDLAFDVFGVCVLGVRLNAGCHHPDYRDETGLVGAFQETLRGCTEGSSWLPLPLLRAKEQPTTSLDTILKSIILKSWAGKTDHHDPHPLLEYTEKSILSLILDDHFPPSPSRKDTPIPEDLLNATCEQLKTFLFAAHDTIPNAISWLLYELYRTPRALKAVREELDRVLGVDEWNEPITGEERLVKDPVAIYRMPYISAVVKESLRLHTSSGAGRYFPPGSGVIVRGDDGREFCLDAAVVYTCTDLIHRDRTVYGDTADQFLPERWLEDHAIPESAWRPFERGARSCIAEEFTMQLLTTVVALVARTYDLEKVGLGKPLRHGDGRAMVGDNGQVIGEWIYATRTINGAAKPVDGMMMNVQWVPPYDPAR
ncbi:cytochrome P450 [Podospora australis]|uniref:Cytochrome P450 n=1 Tax=Podospora australis TaxID=1536484 RepID=A0AAN6WL88_9PEZI|nr:cytochrome P450 [Podospora australis]